MIVHDCIQGTPEWTALRSGIPTASQFDRIVTPKGNPCGAKTSEKYRHELIAERIMGHPITDFTSRWMDRGSQTEAEAVNFYEFTRDLPSVKVGFITNDSETVGASPDRLVGDKGLLEIKVPSDGVHVSYLMQSGNAYDEYKVQTQGQMWIAEREWNDLLSYHPEMPEALYRIERDEKFISIMADLVGTFSAALEQDFALCLDRGWVKQRKITQPSEQEKLIKALKDSLVEMKK